MRCPSAENAQTSTYASHPKGLRRACATFSRCRRSESALMRVGYFVIQLSLAAVLILLRGSAGELAFRSLGIVTVIVLVV